MVYNNFESFFVMILIIISHKCMFSHHPYDLQLCQKGLTVNSNKLCLFWADYYVENIAEVTYLFNIEVKKHIETGKCIFKYGTNVKTFGQTIRIILVGNMASIRILRAKVKKKKKFVPFFKKHFHQLTIERFSVNLMN